MFVIKSNEKNRDILNKYHDPLKANHYRAVQNFFDTSQKLKEFGEVVRLI